MKLCKDCKYFSYANPLSKYYSTCMYNPTIDVVHGTPQYRCASAERLYTKEFNEHCGEEGRFWEPKECQNLIAISPSSSASSETSFSTISKKVKESFRKPFPSRWHLYLGGLLVFIVFWIMGLVTGAYLFMR